MPVSALRTSPPAAAAPRLRLADASSSTGVSIQRTRGSAGSQARWVVPTTQTSKGSSVRLRSTGRARALPEELAVMLFKSAQELLTNSLKHSGASAADLAKEIADVGGDEHHLGDAWLGHLDQVGHHGAQGGILARLSGAWLVAKWRFTGGKGVGELGHGAIPSSGRDGVGVKGG